MNAVRLLDDARSAEALLDGTRLRLMQALDGPMSASGLASRLGLPRQQVNYHLRKLERAGLVEHVEDRRRRNCTERVMRATARSYLIAPQVLGSLAADPDRVPDKLSSTYLVAAAARIIGDLARLRPAADRDGKRLATITLETDIRFRSAAERNAFAEELAQALGALAARYHDEDAPGGRRFRVVVGGYPAITRRLETTDEEPDHA